MKAITLTQPWATLMAIGAKTVETRSWSTRYRGLLAIHAAASATKDERRMQYMVPFATALGSRSLPMGRILAVVRLLDIVRTESVLSGERTAVVEGQPLTISGSERAFGNYTAGRWAWITDTPVELPDPIPAIGKLSLWDVVPEVGQRLEDLWWSKKGGDLFRGTVPRGS